jgi:tetratricopeptide (TPR) repeat protein
MTMSGDDPTRDPDRLARIERALAEYLLAADAGAAPESAAWLAQYPRLQPELGELLAAEAGLRRLADPLRPVPGQAMAAEAATVGSGEHLAEQVKTIAGDSDAAAPLPPLAIDPGVTTDRLDGNALTAHIHPESTSAALSRGALVRYFGDYEIRRELGRGGMGVVYEARQISLNRPVALKMIKAGVLADDADLRRFQNEAEAVAMLDHPGIVQVHEVGEHHGQRYFSMKLVPGTSLAAQLDRYRDDPRAATLLLAEAAEAVHHAHMRGILHRDLKPANILIDDQGHPHVTDFGLAKKVEGDSELTQSGAILGTPAYMAPEQTTGHRGAVTTATDVYGLGAVLYALLVGKSPFGGDSVVETLDAVQTRPPEPPSRLNAKVPRDLEVICLKCLEKDPARRYRSADGLAEDLRRWLDGRPIAARPVSAAVRAWMWCRRHPVPAGLSAALVLAVLAGSIASAALWLRAERNYRNEQAARGEAQARLNMAMEAIRIYYTGVSEDMLLKEPQMKSLRDKLLGTALDFYKRLQQSLEGNPDTRAQADLAEAYYRVGEITYRVGSRGDAGLAHQRALAIRERLTAAYPTDDDYQRDFAASLFKAGEVRRALGIRERLAAAHPEIVRYQIDLAESLSDGTTLGALDANQLTDLRHNGERLQAMVAAYPTVPEIRRSLARLYNLLAGDQAFAEGNLDVMLSFNQRSRQILEEATALTDADRLLLFSIHWGTAHALGFLGRRGEALSARLKAAEIVERLHAENAGVKTYSYQLVMALQKLGEAHLEVGQLREAEAALRRARTIGENLVREEHGSPRPGFQETFNFIYTALGRLAAKMGRPDEGSELCRLAVQGWERTVVNANRELTDLVGVNYRISCFIIACDALIEVRGPIEPLLHARATFEKLDQTGELKPMTRPVLLWLDIGIAKAHRQAGRSDEATKVIHRLRSELEILHVGPPSWYPYNVACALAQLSTLVGRPDRPPTPAEKAEIRDYQRRAMDMLRRAVAVAERPRAEFRVDHDLDPLHGLPEYQLLLLDVDFPDDPFARGD